MNIDAQRAAPTPILPTRAKKRLIVFVHGIGGKPDASTWGRFPDLVAADPELSARYDIAMFSYPSSFGGVVDRNAGSTRVPAAAQMLSNRFTADWNQYDEVAIIAHSQGGLVTRRYVADEVAAYRTPRIRRVLYFATPHTGSRFARQTGSIPRTSDELGDLGYDSEMYQRLLTDEANTGSYLRLIEMFAVAPDDGVVYKTSAWGRGLPGKYRVIEGTGHRSIAKPETAKDDSFKCAKAFLLDESLGTVASPDAIHDQPLLDSKLREGQTVEEVQRARFVYWNRLTPFGGRDAEVDTIGRFLFDPNGRFGWMLVTGPGGTGKSRLALEIVLAQSAMAWNAGFLDRRHLSHQRTDYWDLWQPRLPTLIVIDYAAQEPEKVEVLLLGLASRKPPHLLRQPVRVLLLDRYSKDERLAKLLDNARSPVNAKAVRGKDLELARANVSHILAHLLPGRADDQRTALTALDEIDKEHRPLFAYLVGDAVARGANVHGWDRDALLEDVVKRERREFWEPAAERGGLGKRIEKEERALALATMRDGLPIGSLQDADGDVLPRWDHDRHPTLFRVMSGTMADEFIAPLLPGIVGEFFVLEVIEKVQRARTKGGSTFPEILAEHSWQDELATAQFLSRCWQDFPDRPGLKHLFAFLPRHPLGQAMWSLVASQAIAHLVRDESTRQRAFELYDDIKSLSAAHSITKFNPTSAELTDVWNPRELVLIQHLPENEGTSRRVLQVRPLAPSHPTCSAACEPQQAKVSENLTQKIRDAMDPAYRLWLAREQAAFHLIYQLLESDSTRERALQIGRELMGAAPNYAKARSVVTTYFTLLCHVDAKAYEEKTHEWPPAGWNDALEAAAIRFRGELLSNFERRIEIDSDRLKEAIERMRDCSARLVESVFVRERVDSTVGAVRVVNVFELDGHPAASKAYAWVSVIEGSERQRIFVVLHQPPIASAIDAVGAALAAEDQSLSQP